ncbi:diaminopimelate decarboxylase [Ferrimonas lipolytica]|uniref:Diaminopimelate decarboxylase n=1 Tax=Ferrimonas lipolytica TaxID=2724191 RepID=A0A6H1UH11_9GAMM|nr:diaminopimelate decarboxylase [Ferrimonas lipolytica]QIZ78108.1 diaminopimelate decarboxylase [Ferrimonas lipolytica]
MDHFNYHNNALHAEQVALTDIAAQFGTPCYVYSRATIERHYQAFTAALSGHPHLICYAVKANSNLAVLNVLARLGSGFDIVSGGELARVIEAGGDPTKVVFSGVAKTAEEIATALKAGIHCFNVESEPELDRINEVARQLDMTAPVSLRVNPDVDAQTHPYISTGLKQNKFGIAMERAETAYLHAQQLPHLEVIGADCHIGSQLTSLEPFIDALDRLLALVDRLAEHGIKLKHLDVGGGLGVNYQDEQPPLPADYATAIKQRLSGRKLTLIMEPGRAIMANAGVMLTKVEFLKQGDDRDFAIVDAAMNDLLRPALYSAWQEIVAVTPRHGTSKAYDVVGPVCETGDFLGKDRQLVLQPEDLLAVRSSGAYGFTMASNYNSRPRVAEVMVDGSQPFLIRQRETLQQLWQGEALLP